MEADFSGWATKSNVKCSDGRTILPNAFGHQDKMRVPLVWQHGHKDPENVLGHAILEARPEGVYAHAYFNDTEKAKHARQLVVHKDINMMSIWANQLVERAKQVRHGMIKEVSLVLSGANPGAVIENVSIRHSDGEVEDLEDEALIYTDLEFEHTAADEDDSDNDGKEKMDIEEEPKVEHADGDDETLEDIYNTLTDKQKDVVAFIVGEAINSAEHSDLDDTNDDAEKGKEESETMAHKNVFEKKDDAPVKNVLSHDDMEGILKAAEKGGKLQDAVEEYALAHGIEDIDVLFPDAKDVDTGGPSFHKRRTEWVSVVMDGVHKVPFSNIRTRYADLTLPQARAKGYVKGNLKREEFFKVYKRVTSPTTIYKKQKLERDDVIDITDFDVVVWMKAEMRIMLDEEIARAILVGDGRDGDDEDKIDEEKIRPIATDDELYTTVVNVNIADGSSSIQEATDALITHRKELRGTGLPTMFTSETYIAQWTLRKDSTGRALYPSLAALATELRVKEIVPVEVLEEEPYSDIIAILVNLQDYTLGANKGGQTTFFEDFDIDYNAQKYLLETRLSGALSLVKSAMVLKAVASDVTLVTPTAPTFNEVTGVITIPSQTGVVYKDEDDNTLSSGAQAALDEGETMAVYAYPSSASYAFNSSEDDVWTFTRLES